MSPFTLGQEAPRLVRIAAWDPQKAVSFGLMPVPCDAMLLVDPHFTVILVCSKYWIRDLAPPLYQTTIIQDMLVAVLHTSGEEVLILGSGEE